MDQQPVFHITDLDVCPCVQRNLYRQQAESKEMDPYQRQLCQSIQCVVFRPHDRMLHRVKLDVRL